MVHGLAWPGSQAYHPSDYGKPLYGVCHLIISPVLAHLLSVEQPRVIGVPASVEWIVVVRRRLQIRLYQRPLSVRVSGGLVPRGFDSLLHRVATLSTAQGQNHRLATVPSRSRMMILFLK